MDDAATLENLRNLARTAVSQHQSLVRAALKITDERDALGMLDLTGMTATWMMDSGSVETAEELLAKCHEKRRK